MNHLRTLTKSAFAATFVFAFLQGLVSASLAQAADVPQSFTLDGRLYADVAGTTPLADSTIQFKVQILDENKVCVVYEESQTVNTQFSQGYFSVQVGTSTGSATRTIADVGNSMSTVFQNLNVIAGKKLSDGTACNVAAVGGQRRFVRITISPSSLGGASRTLSPDLTIDSVPNAVVAERAETLQGYRSSDMLKVNSSGSNVLTQSNLESLFMTSTRFNALSALVDGTSTSYVKSSSNGAQIPVLTGAPAAPTQGAIWYDTSDNRLKYRTGINTTETLGTGSGSVSSVSLTAPSELSVAGAPITGSGTIALTWANQTTNKVFAAPDGSTGAPSFRALTANDIPSLPWTKLVPSTNGIASGAAVNLATSVSHTLASVGGSTIALSGMQDGQVYNVVVEDPASRTYTFTGCLHAYFKPANAATTLNTRTVYGIMTVKKGPDWDCYITWSSGFQE